MTKCEITKDEAHERFPHIPDSTLKELYRYVDDRLRTGPFLRAVLCNDLTEAYYRADIHNQPAINDIYWICQTVLPAQCWGSCEEVDQWLYGKKEEAVAQTN